MVLVEKAIASDRESWQQISEERRLLYMAMTRARQRLYLNYEGRWPQPLTGMLELVDRVLV
jgi:superfamily I DNA/RNA helicase